MRGERKEGEKGRVGDGDRGHRKLHGTILYNKSARHEKTTVIASPEI